MTIQPNVFPSSTHPLNTLFKPGEEKQQRSKLVAPLLTGLAEAGAVFRHLRLGQPVRHDGQYQFDLDGWLWAFRLSGYCNLSWVWRITVGTPLHTHCLTDHRELTMAVEEIDEQMGRDLAQMLRSIARGEKPVWALFDGCDSFPQYAWSRLCQARYDEWRTWRDARHEFLSRKNARTPFGA